MSELTAACDRKSSGNLLGGVCLAIVLLCSTPLAVSEKVAQGRYWAADIHPQPPPGIRFVSGLAVCDEANGPLNGRVIT